MLSGRPWWCFRVVSSPLEGAPLALGRVPILALFIDIFRDSFKGTSRYLLTSEYQW